MALAALVPLVALAALMPAMEPSYDTRGIQPEDTESNRGYAALARHYPVNEVLPEYVLVSSDHDMRNARDLATLEQAAAAAARTPGVALVRSVTRPDGEAIDQARVSYQAGVIGRKLRRAGDDVASGTEGARTLADGSAQVDEGAEELAAGADQAVEGAGLLVDALEELRSGLTGLEDGAGEAVTGTGELREGARMLAAGLDAAYSQTKTAVDGLGMALDGLESSLPCTLDPICNRARDGVRQVYEGERDQLLPGLRDAAAAARRIAEAAGDLQAGLRQLDDGLAQARAGVEEITAGQREFRARLGELADGTEQLAEGTGQVAAGTSEVAGSVGELEGGLSEAADYLTSTAERADTSAMGGFYLPPSALADDRFAAASRLFISSDGRTARIAVLGTDDAFSSEAAERSTEVRQVIENSLRDSRLQDADVVTTGMASANADLAAIEARDFRLIVAVALVTVFLILLALLRSVVAALFLLATVVLSYASAVGLGVLVFQMILDEPLEWSVPSLAFILLVAVGADYNLLLTKRMQEEAPDGSRAGIARAAAATGVIFAASMFALMAGSVDSLVQTGFVIGAGLLIDTFVVRTMLVPAIAAMLGPRLWWPRRRAPRPTVAPVTTVATR
jgi:RND superfamily putative drug exporter